METSQARDDLAEVIGIWQQQVVGLSRHLAAAEHVRVPTYMETRASTYCVYVCASVCVCRGGGGDGELQRIAPPLEEPLLRWSRYKKVI